MHIFFNFYTKFKIYLLNTSWIVGEKAVSFSLGFLVTVLVARYLGPIDYGRLSYALSVVAVFASAGHLGLHGLVVRELVREPGKTGETLGTSLALKSLTALLVFLLILFYGFLFERGEQYQFEILLIVAISVLISPVGLIDLWFEAHVQAKYSVMARTGALVITSLFRIFIVLIQANILYFALASPIQSALAALFLIIAFRTKNKISTANWRFSMSRARELLGQGWLIYLGSIFAVVNMKIDQVMLKQLVGPEEVGIYAVAASLSEVWYFLPVAIVGSFFPRLIILKREEPELFGIRMQQIFDLLFILALFIALPISLMSGVIIDFCFGDAYSKSAGILSIHIWASLFIFMRALLSRWIIIEDELVFSLITQGLGAALNIALNIYFIPEYGAYGAAMVTLFSYAMSSYLALLFSRKTRPIFLMMTKSVFYPLRALLYVASVNKPGLLRK